MRRGKGAGALRRRAKAAAVWEICKRSKRALPYPHLLRSTERQVWSEKGRSGRATRLSFSCVYPSYFLRIASLSLARLIIFCSFYR